MDQDMKSARVNPWVAPGSGVDLGLEQGEIEALHVALAAGVAQGLEIAGVPRLVLVRRILREVLAVAPCRSQRHFRAIFLGTFVERPTSGPLLSRARSQVKRTNFEKILFEGNRYSTRFIVDCRLLLSIRELKAHGFVRSIETRCSKTRAEAYRGIFPFFFFFRGTVFTQDRLRVFNCSNSAVDAFFVASRWKKIRNKDKGIFNFRGI